MHCPQCGQQQTSNELRFCSRCGFPLGGVTELMANGGIIPQYQPPSPVETERKISPRRKGVQQGVALIFLAAVLTPLFAVLNAYLSFPEMFIALSSVIGFIGGALRVIYALIFEEGAPKEKVVYVNAAGPQPASLPHYPQPAPPRPLADMNRSRTLPQQSVPVSNWRRSDTSELLNPPSVTENTTKLLDKREQDEPPK